MKKLSTVLSFILIALMFIPAGNMSAQKKKDKESKGGGGGDWIKSLPNMPIKDGYYQGLGAVPVTKNQSDDANKAESDARAMVVRAIRSEITNKVTNVVEETTAGGASTLTESFNEVTESFSSETLKNLKVQFHRDEKKAKKTLCVLRDLHCGS